MNVNVKQMSNITKLQTLCHFSLSPRHSRSKSLLHDQLNLSQLKATHAMDANHAMHDVTDEMHATCAKTIATIKHTMQSK